MADIAFTGSDNQVDDLAFTLKIPTSVGKRRINIYLTNDCLFCKSIYTPLFDLILYKHVLLDTVASNKCLRVPQSAYLCFKEERLRVSNVSLSATPP